MQYLHTANICVSIRHDDEKTKPTVEEFVKALEAELKWWKDKPRTKEDLMKAVDWGIVLDRYDDNDVWCH